VGITWDVLATLAAGLIGAVGALAGVMLQRRFEKRDRIAEEDNQRKEIAKALVYEIDGTYTRYLVPLRAALDRPVPGNEHQIQLPSPPAYSFPIYHANAYRIGEYKGEEVRAMVDFYTLADSFVCILADAVKAKSNLHAASNLALAQGAAREAYRELRETIPNLVPLARDAARLLGARAGLPLEGDRAPRVIREN
jgi:hypothetical protein